MSDANGKTRDLYIDLLEKAVTHRLYFPTDRRETPAQVQESFADAIREAGIIDLPDFDEEDDRQQGKDWPLFAQTMIGGERIRNVRECTETALRDEVPGDLIEAGCWRGGTVIFMRGILKAYGINDRVVYGADSFQGLPKPNEDRFPADTGDINFTVDELRVPVQEVRANLDRYGLDDDRVRLVEGWFRDTLPTLRDRTWALVRLDGDLYESTMDGLENLYPQLSPGGFLIIDDYGWDNCRQAVEDYREANRIADPIERIDWVGAFWRKT